MVHLLFRAPCKRLVDRCPERQTEKSLMEIKFKINSCALILRAAEVGLLAPQLLKCYFFQVTDGHTTANRPPELRTMKALSSILPLVSSPLEYIMLIKRLLDRITYITIRSCNSSCHVIKFETN